MIKFELVDPKTVIEKYLYIWNKGCDENNTEIEVFKNINEDISNYDCVKGKVYNNYDKDDLEPLFGKIKESKDGKDISENLIGEIVKKLDGIYHTMLKNRDETKNNIFNNREKIVCLLNKIKLDDDNTKKELVDYIACINKSNGGGNYIYSFATKFCSFLAPETFPIFDSVASTLVQNYLNIKKKKTGNLGDYGVYLKAYEEFRNAYNLEGYTYKQVDSFLWLYGKIMSEYWKNIGVISFNSVYYKPPTILCKR